jgi:RNA polymerase sigma factor (TIGR02999 family)
MADSSDSDVTGLLIAWSAGDEAALDRLVPMVESRLRRLAGSFMRGERDDHILQTDALVNEAYLRLVDQNRAEWANRAQFFAICARIMRRVLVDDARGRRAAKRFDARPRVTFSGLQAESPAVDLEIVALHEALEKLTALDERQAAVVELRCFAGATVEETAEALDIAPATVKRDWATALAWLHRELEASD